MRVQSEHFAWYRRALDRLEADGLLYPCFCTRAAIKAEMARAAGAPHGEEGPIYPGTCRGAHRGGARGADRGGRRLGAPPRCRRGAGADGAAVVAG